MSKSNLCIVGLSKQFADNICKKLSIKLDMFYANIEEIIEFELIDLNRMEELCGIEYLNKKEYSIIKRVCSYENTLLTLNCNKLNTDKILSVITNNCLIIYLRFDRKNYKKYIHLEGVTDNEKKIDLDVFSDRDYACKQIADISIECSNLNEDEIIDNTIQHILKYYS